MEGLEDPLLGALDDDEGEDTRGAALRRSLSMQPKALEAPETPPRGGGETDAEAGVVPLETGGETPGTSDLMSSMGSASVAEVPLPALREGLVVELVHARHKYAATGSHEHLSQYLSVFRPGTWCRCVVEDCDADGGYTLRYEDGPYADDSYAFVKKRFLPRPCRFVRVPCECIRVDYEASYSYVTPEGRHVTSHAVYMVPLVALSGVPRDARAMDAFEHLSSSSRPLEGRRSIVRSVAARGDPPGPRAPTQVLAQLALYFTYAARTGERIEMYSPMGGPPHWDFSETSAFPGCRDLRSTQWYRFWTRLSGVDRLPSFLPSFLRR